MVEPDPWNIIDKKQETSNNCDSSNLSLTNNIPSTFEDNFLQSNTSNSLPDSKEYLQALERKLSKLKNTSNYLDQLKARREHCIENLLVGNLSLNSPDHSEELRLEEDFETNRRRELLRHIQPEQAINLGELVTIIRHDYLAQEQEQQQQQPDSNSPFEDDSNVPK